MPYKLNYFSNPNAESGLRKNKKIWLNQRFSTGQYSKEFLRMTLFVGDEVCLPLRDSRRILLSSINLDAVVIVVMMEARVRIPERSLFILGLCEQEKAVIDSFILSGAG
jgi:hypothetical protein